MEIPLVNNDLEATLKNGDVIVYPKNGGKSISIERLKDMGAGSLKDYKIKFFSSRLKVETYEAGFLRLDKIRFLDGVSIIVPLSEKGKPYDSTDNAFDLVERYYQSRVDEINKVIASVNGRKFG
jgi:RNA polymerase-interacting CarD/CdnL/TRCF family regulator